MGFTGRVLAWRNRTTLEGRCPSSAALQYRYHMLCLVIEPRPQH